MEVIRCKYLPNFWLTKLLSEFLIERTIDQISDWPIDQISDWSNYWLNFWLTELLIQFLIPEKANNEFNISKPETLNNHTIPNDGGFSIQLYSLYHFFF